MTTGGSERGGPAAGPPEGGVPGVGTPDGATTPDGAPQAGEIRPVAPRLGLVVTAGGYGRRLGLDGPKQYVPLGGRPMLARTVAALAACPEVHALVVVVNEEDVPFCRDEVLSPDLLGAHPEKLLAVVAGGAERPLSVRAGVRALAECGEFDLIGVHDGARPFITCPEVRRAVARLEADASLAGVVVALPSTDTIKVVDESGVVHETPVRSGIWRAQTPQIFRAPVLTDAYAVGEATLLATTDDASLVEAHGGRVAVTEGSPENLKVTTPLDLRLAELIAEQRDAEAAERRGADGRVRAPHGPLTESTTAEREAR